MKLYLASGNPHKAEELRALAEADNLPIEIHTASAVGGMPAVVEDTGTFEGNAQKKARALKALLPADGWALADDSGLCVDELNGEPGVESAYYAGPAGDAAANLQKLVTVMNAVPAHRRGARFVSVLVLIAPDGREMSFFGKATGRLLDRPRGGDGFGYDPLFAPDGDERTFAELSATEKNLQSHRARAWVRLVAWVKANDVC